MHRVAAFAIALITLVSPIRVKAQEVLGCNDSYQANVQFLVEPWNDNSLALADGRVRVALMDTYGEPVAGSAWLYIRFPDEKEPVLDPIGQSQCVLVGAGNGLGFFGFDFQAVTVTEVPGQPITVTFPVSVANEDVTAGVAKTLTLMLDIEREVLSVGLDRQMKTVVFNEEDGAVSLR